ncbi:hypothetical protein [Acinetobacter sp. YH12145]|uniref:hypothetical protein n=1 Tax=Acinetobacter sp. YH12145 TaxID=2601129 RepID=UPI0015D1EDD7|nr:hypothetical protein [Acinetobacter sp. YH12145]
MKKLLAIGTLSLISSLATAENAIVLQSGEPLPLGASANTVQNRSSTNNSYLPSGGYVSAGYAGSKIGSSEFGGDERFNGFFLNAGTYVAPKTSLYMEYAFQDASEMDFSEVILGLNYKFLENDKNYASVGGGIGYAWLDEKAYDPYYDMNVSLELNYLTLPLYLEVGHQLNANFEIFGNLGYKWFFNRDSEACIDGLCVSGNSSDLDIDGMTYKAGLRYNF